MARLSIDIGVNLSDSLKQLGSLNSSLIELNKNANTLVSSLKAIGGLKINPQIGGGQANVKPQVKLFDTSKQEQALANALDEIIVNVGINVEKARQELDAKWGPILAQAEADAKLASQNINNSLNSIQVKGDIWDDYRSGAIQAGTAIEYLEKKQADLITEANRLKLELGRAVNSDQYKRLQEELNRTEKELNDVTRAVQAQKAPVGGANSAYGSLTKTTNLANLSITNFGRVLQDLPFGLLGIANNINPLVEGLKQLSDQAKQNGRTLKQELLGSLKGFGGLSLAISGVTSALSFASVGLSYWTRELRAAKDEQDKLNEGFAQATSSAFETGIQLQILIKEAQAYTEGSIEQTRALNQINELLGENTTKVTAANLANGEAVEIARQLTEALVEQGAAQFAITKAGELSAKKRVLEARQTFLSSQKGVVAYSMFLQKSLDDVWIIPDSAVDFSNYLMETFGTDLMKNATEYRKNAEELGTLTNQINDFTKVANESREKFQAAFKGVQATGRVGELQDLIKNVKRQIENLSEPEGRQKTIWNALKNQLKDYEDELDRIQGKKPRGTTAGKSIAQQVADEYKEIRSDLEKIDKLPNIDPLEKASRSSERLRQGLDKILDLDIEQRLKPQFLGLIKEAEKFESKKIGLEVDLITKGLDESLKQIDEKGRILNIDVSKEKIKEAENVLDELYKRFNDRKISPIDKQVALVAIKAVQQRLEQLNLDAFVKQGETAFNDLTIDVEKLQQRKILLGVSIGKEGLNLVKKAIDIINEKKIELLSEKDPERASQLNDEIEKAQDIFSQFRSVAIGESFQEYQKSAKQIGDEFQRASKFLPKQKRLELKIEANKDNLQEVSKSIDELIKLGISPIDPRLIFLKILQTKLKINIEIDEKKRKQIEEETQLLRDNLTSQFTDMGDALGTALAEGGKVGYAIGKSVLESMGRFLSELGKYYITASELISKAGPLIGSPMGLAAGIAMVALGAFVRSLAAQGFAEGGFVSGPGSSRSDSIPARLSNGEFVVQAKSVRKYGRGFMEMLNSGSMPITNYRKNFGDLRFADGGFVARQFGRDGGSAKALVNRMDMGGGGFIAETKISGQDLRLVLKRADSNYSKTT